MKSYPTPLAVVLLTSAAMLTPTMTSSVYAQEGGVVKKLASAAGEVASKAEKKAAELKAKQEAEAKKAAEKAAVEKARAEKKAAELKAKQEAEAKRAAEKAAAEKAAAEKKAAELKAKQEAEAKKAAEKKARLEREAAEQAAAEKAKAEKKAAELKAKQEAEAKKAAEKAAAEKAATEKKAAELKAKKEAEAKKAAEKAAAEKAAAEKKAAELKAKQEAEAKKAAEKAAFEKDVSAAKAKLVGERQTELDTANKAVSDASGKIASAESALATAKADLAKAKNAKTPDTKAIDAAKAKVAAAKADLSKAEDALVPLEKARRKATEKLAAAEEDARAEVAAARKASGKAAAEKIAAEKKAAELKEKAAKEAAAAEKNEKRTNREQASEKLAIAEQKYHNAEKDYDAAEAEMMLAQSMAEGGDLYREKEEVETALQAAKSAVKTAEAAVQAAKGREAAAEDALVKARAGKDAAAIKKAEEDLAAARKAVAASGNALQARNDDLATANKAYAALYHKLPAKPISPVAAQQRFDAADKFLIEARRDLIEAQEAWSALNPRRVLSDTKRMSLESAKKRLAAAVPAYVFKGDVIWLASTYVNGIPLYSYFRKGTFEEAAKNARRNAIEAGYYMAGFAEDGEENGKKIILVDKGRVGAINVSYVDEAGNELNADEANYSSKQIKRMVGQGRVSPGASEGGVFNFDAISSRFYELNGHPDIARADLAFSPGTYEYLYEDGSKGDQHALTMDVKVQEEEFPLHFVFGIDNFGSADGEDASFGTADEWMARLTAQYLNLWQAGHILTVNGNTSLGNSLWGFAGSYMIPRLDNGRWWDWTWTLHGGYTDVDEEDVIPQIDVEGKGWFAGVQLSNRLLDTGRSTLDLSLGVTYRKVESAVVIEGEKFEYGKNGEGYEILPASIALMYSETALDSFGGRNYATAEGVYNLGGSSVEELKYVRYAIEEDNYWLARVQFARIQMLGDFNDRDATGLPMLFVRAEGQYADSPVVGAEQYSIGGHGTVRGYKEREFLGDTGCAGTVELRSPIILGLFDRTPEEGAMALDRVQFVVFLDAGWYNLEKGRGTDEDDNEFIMGAGVGFRAALGEWSQLRCDIGFPLVKDDEAFDTDACRVYLSLQFQW